ncbi:MAG: helix-turn-helix domain-containing protein [Spirochaetaceae bacterium]|jgi:DNA-binding LacI/PurR family transcriptional regulator/AraC-like DNA-binding protein|nr:helix-turn-helix domain-containing protein [Spirochaetaceae bacterium]
MAEKKRVGLVLASIHTGLSLNVWGSFVRTAAAENTSLFIFPGGRLNARHNFENLRNTVYSLVNDENLDGCISWSSTIRYTEPKEEFELFHGYFDPLPYVTLGFKLPGHPCVEFDAYNGMKALVNHCIHVHGASKIAFLHGPEFHQSAHARFEGYCDALTEGGLVPKNTGKKGAVQSPLISGPFNWDAGAAAAAQLFKDRSLIPGRDFDTLVGSSDLMALGAINYFAGHGYHVPGDYRAVGFNNSEESRITQTPLSTVQVPYSQMSAESFRILRKIMGKKKNSSDNDILLNSDLIIRESCGCSGIRLFGGREGASPNSNVEEILARMAGDCFKLGAADMDALARPVIHALFHEGREQFFSLFEKNLIHFFNLGREPENFLMLLDEAANLELPEHTRGLLPFLYRSVTRIYERFTVQARYKREGWNTVLNSLKCDLLSTRDRSSLVQNLAHHLPKIGIRRAAIVLYDDEKTSIFVGGFSDEGICPIKDQRFPVRLLVPAPLKPWYADGIFMVQPLFIENQSLGYFVHNVPINDGVIFEELRSTVSYALKGIFLLEETVKAKKIAEQAERAKTEFLQIMENGLYDPLQGVMEKLEALEKQAFLDPPSAPDHDTVLRSLQELKSFVTLKEAEAGSFLDFTLARIDELSLRKTIFDPKDLLPKIGNFPLLSGDTARLAQCFSLIREQYGAADAADNPAEYSAELTYGGFSVTFHGQRRDEITGKAEKVRQFCLLLAERIILMHGGDFFPEKDHCTVILPWPTLSGQEASRNPVSSGDHILVLSDPALLPVNFFSLPQIRDTGKNKPGKVAFIAWNAAGASPGDLVKAASLRRKNEFSNVPFLCYGMPAGSSAPLDSAASLIDAIEFALRSPKKGTILFIGYKYPDGDFELLLSRSNALVKKQNSTDAVIEKTYIDSMDSFNETVGEINPLLIVFNSLDVEGAAAVRRYPLTMMVPIIMISSRVDNAVDVNSLSQLSRLIICHRAVVSSPEFRARIMAIVNGAEILPPHTGVLVKKALLNFDKHVKTHISRWKLADSVNVSEDYLTRIFHKEMGLPLWDYLNRYRIFLAAELLQQTDDTIQEVANKCGFQDQAYFCRVFKKIYGVSPGQTRKK